MKKNIDQKFRARVAASDDVVAKVFKMTVEDILNSFGIEDYSVEQIRGAQTFLEIFARLKKENDL